MTSLYKWSDRGGGLTKPLEVVGINRGLRYSTRVELESQATSAVENKYELDHTNKLGGRRCLE